MVAYVGLSLNMEYQPSTSPKPFITYSDADADHGGNLDNGKSTGGYVVKIGSGAVSWSSKLQSLVALSTTEAEPMSAVEVGNEILWMCSFMGELGYDISGPSLLRMDNQSAIAVSKNPEHHSKMKHLSLRLFWLRDAVQDGLIAPTFVPTQEMAADIFTKALDRFKVQRCTSMLGLFAFSCGALHIHGGVLFVANVLCLHNAPAPTFLI
jgi:hypothetical protein